MNSNAIPGDGQPQFDRCLIIIADQGNFRTLCPDLEKTHRRVRLAFGSCYDIGFHGQFAVHIVPKMLICNGDLNIGLADIVLGLVAPGSLVIPVSLTLGIFFAEQNITFNIWNGSAMQRMPTG